MLQRVLFVVLSAFLLQPAYASFFDRPDYFQNKMIYDEVEEIIEILYDTNLSDHDKELRLVFKDKKLVPVFKALKVENEKRLVASLKSDSIPDDEIENLLRDRPVIDGLKMTMENDFLAGTDVYYTNGLRVELSFNNPEFEKFFKKLGFDHSDFFFLCGQNIYNTSNNDVDKKRPNEPPNAGVLYCGGAVNSYKMDKDKQRARSMQRIEAQLGTIGRGSYAQQVQNGFHHLIGDKQVNWDYQVADRFYFNVNFQKFVKIGEGDLYGDSNPEYNIIINGGGNAGSLTNYINAGVVFNYRLMGTLIDMYIGNKMTPSLAEELAMMSPENRLKRILCNSNWSLNLYFGSEAKLVFNNYRIDGSNDYFTTTVPFVVDLKAGVVVRYKRVFFDLGIVRRSSEWNNTNGHHDGPPHTYGMLTITIRFDNFRDLGEQASAPIRWIVDPAYRKKLMEEQKIKDVIARDGLKVVFDSKNPNTPPKELNITCH
ncbi:MAG: hypothetical protein RI953_382 [Pseudomonadota bacterium]|jgi:hypothetical protein